MAQVNLDRFKKYEEWWKTLPVQVLNEISYVPDWVEDGNDIRFLKPPYSEQFMTAYDMLCARWIIPYGQTGDTEATLYGFTPCGEHLYESIFRVQHIEKPETGYTIGMVYDAVTHKLSLHS